MIIFEDVPAARGWHEVVRRRVSFDPSPVVHAATLLARPELGAAVARLAGQVTRDIMRRRTYAVDGEHQEPAEVVREFLDALDCRVIS